MAPEVKRYSFGRIEIDDRVYTSDVIITPEGVMPGWWRKEGHRLCLEDLKDVWDKNPEVIIIGTGAYGVMKVPQDVVDEIKKRGVEVEVARTGHAVKLYNEMKDKRRVFACLHLTC
ncbi:hypothetical protein DRQ20_00585 [bacterium]|nr:MAG: hypothetical protein DRQ18_02555 [bacterium]RKZ27388.1 MAG: hypothetical protein DRQ20_00585 [bacterium]